MPHTHTKDAAAQHRVFSVYAPTVTFTSDSGATDILMRYCDSHILQNYTSYSDASARPGFDVANYQQIYPIAHGILTIPNTTITMTAFVFHDDDLHSNLFGVAPLTNQGLSATYTNDDLQITTPTPNGPQTILYGLKEPGDNVWRFSLPKARPSAAYNVIRHEQHAELALYASATFGSPTYKTFHNALAKGWLSNYPSLTAKILSRNQPHSPATALGHITASRSGIRSTKPKRPREPTGSPAQNPSSRKVLATTRAQALRPLNTNTPRLPVSPASSPSTDSSDSDSDSSITPDTISGLPALESHTHYETHELPTTILQTRILPPSDLRDNAMFSDLTGRFPATAMDGSQYILLSVYKQYIHLELLASRSEAAIIDAYSRTYQWFSKLGHFVRFQVMDNEAPKALRQYFISNDIRYEFVPPHTKRSNKAERAIQTFKRHFIAILASTHPSFPINFWHELIPQAEITLNMMRPFADQPNISAYHGIHRAPYDFLSHPLAPCGTLIVLHNSIRETWDNFGHIGFYLGPASAHYRSYRCLVQETNSVRISDSIILFPAPLVVPGASRFDQLLALTERISIVAETTDVPDARAQLFEALALLKTFLAKDSQAKHIVVPNSTSGPTRHRPSSDTGADIIGWHFTEKSLGKCIVLAPDTFLDENKILWHTLQVSCSKYPLDSNVFKVSEVRTYIRRDRTAHGPSARSPPPGSTVLRPTLSPELRHPLENDSPFRSILLPPKCVPPDDPRLPAKSTRDARRRVRAARAFSAKVRFAGPDSDAATTTAPDTLNLDVNGKPLTYSSAKRGPDRLAWEKAEAEEITRLILSGTIVPISHSSVPQERWTNNEIVYYNPVVKQKRNDDGTIQYRVRGTAGGNLLDVPYDVSARTAGLDTVKLLLHSVISGDYSWMTIDIADFYLGTPLPASRYEYLRINVDKIPPSILAQYNLSPLIYNKHVYFEIRKCMYGLPQAGKLSQTRLIAHLSSNGYVQCPNTPCLFRHRTRDIIFCLVVDDFGVRYKTQADADHLIQTLEQHEYKLKVRPLGDLYLGMKILFDRQKHTVAISMPGYIRKMLLRFRPQFLLQGHRAPRTPGVYIAPSFSKKPQIAFIDKSEKLSPTLVTELQAIIGTLLYYARAVDPTLLPIANELASQQANATRRILNAANRALSYCAAHSDNQITYHACDMVLHAFADASYLCRSHARSVAGAIFFLGNHNDPTRINGAIHVFSSIIPCVVASAGEAEYAALFATGQHAASLRTTLSDMGYPQPSTTIMCDNTSAIGIATDSIKQKRSKAVDMRFHWIRDRVRQAQFTITYIPTQQNLADYFTKNLPFEAHQQFHQFLVSAATL